MSRLLRPNGTDTMTDRSR